MSAARLLREARVRAGLTQAELARRVGTTQSAVARWEAGAAQPSLEKLGRLVEACGFELRVGLGDYDPAEASLIERNLGLSPSERLEQLTRTVAFIEDGRRALREGHGRRQAL